MVVVRTLRSRTNGLEYMFEWFVVQVPWGWKVVARDKVARNIPQCEREDIGIWQSQSDVRRSERTLLQTL